MNIQTDRAKVAAGTPAVRFCTVTITAPPAAPVAGRAERASSNVAFVIDRSGSMAGSKLEMVKRAVDHALRLLHERDRLALVCYDHEVDVLLGGAPASGEAKTMAGARMRAIDARGNTDLSAGWQAGARELRTIRGSAGSDSVARVLLLSDGLANQGETNPDALAARAETLRNEGITTSTFGVGADFDEHLMSRIATAGGGHFYFIEQAAQIPDLFTSELGEALDIVARDAQLIVRDTGGADTECLNEFPVIRRGDELCIRLGDLTSEQQVTLVLATRIPPQALATAPASACAWRTASACCSRSRSTSPGRSWTRTPTALSPLTATSSLRRRRCWPSGRRRRRSRRTAPAISMVRAPCSSARLRPSARWASTCLRSLP
jgi:Ca-activated chloride channel family protein